MKKKLLDRRGAAIELAVMMMVFSIFITTIILTTALLQNEHKAKAELGIKQDVFLEQLGEDFIAEVLKDHDDPKWYEKWMDGTNGISNYGDDIGEHHWATEEIVINATCTVDGKRVKICKDCGEQEILEIFSAPGHDIEGIPCNAPEDERKCRTCGELVQGEHNGSWEITEEATCGGIGKEKFVCDRCDAKIEREIPASGQHSYIEGKCSVCGAIDPEATEPEATEPEATEPEATEPEAAEPEATEPEATEPEVTEPEATEPEVTEPKGGFSLLVMAADKDTYKLHIEKIGNAEDGLLTGPCGTIVLKITLEWSETDNAYKITEWSKK